MPYFLKFAFYRCYRYLKQSTFGSKSNSGFCWRINSLPGSEHKEMCSDRDICNITGSPDGATTLLKKQWIKLEKFWQPNKHELCCLEIHISPSQNKISIWKSFKLIPTSNQVPEKKKKRVKIEAIEEKH